MAALPLALQPDPDVADAIEVYIDTTVIDETMRVIVDTGGGSSAFAATEQTVVLDAVGSDDGWGATGTVTGHDIVIVPRVSLGSIVARDVRASRIPADDSPHPSSVGMNVLGTTVVTSSSRPRCSRSTSPRPPIFRRRRLRSCPPASR